MKNSPGTAGQRDCPAGVFLVVALLLAGVMYLGSLWVRLPLVDPDEGLHASIAQEMVERGDWITPKLLGEPFLDKPILFTWTQALSLKCFGMNEAAVRLPGMLFGLAAMGAIGLAGWRMFGLVAGTLGAMLYATMALPTMLTHVPVHDVALVPLVTLAVVGFWEADRAASRRGRVGWTVAVGICLGLSCLTKGLVGVALVGVGYGTYLLCTRRLSLGACVRGAAALGIAALVALPWYLAMEGRNPGYLHYYFVDRHLLGYATATQRHGGGPWWYYLPLISLGGLPWLIYLPAGLGRRREIGEATVRPTGDGAVALLLCWLIGCTVFLSVAQSKLMTYIWPVFPAVALLAGLVWARVLDGSLRRWGKAYFSIVFGLASLTAVALLPAALGVARAALGLRFGPWEWASAVLVGLSSWLTYALWRSRRPAAAFSSAILVSAIYTLFLLIVVAPRAAADHTARDLAAYFNTRGRIPSRVVVIEDRIGSVIFYLKPELRRGLRAGQIQGVRARGLGDLLAPLGPDVVVAVADCRMEEAGRFVDLADPPHIGAGRYRLYAGNAFSGATISPGSDMARRPEALR